MLVWRLLGAVLNEQRRDIVVMGYSVDSSVFLVKGYLHYVTKWLLFPRVTSHTFKFWRYGDLHADGLIASLGFPETLEVKSRSRLDAIDLGGPEMRLLIKQDALVRQWRINLLGSMAVDRFGKHLVALADG